MNFYNWQVIFCCRDTAHWALLSSFCFVFFFYRQKNCYKMLGSVLGQHWMWCGLQFGVSFAWLPAVLRNCSLYPKGPSTSVFVEHSNYFSFVARLWSDAVHLPHGCKAGFFLKLHMWFHPASLLEIYLFPWFNVKCVLRLHAKELFHKASELVNLCFLRICALLLLSQSFFPSFLLYPSHPLAALLICFHSVSAPSPKQLTAVVFLILSPFP